MTTESNSQSKQLDDVKASAKAPTDTEIAQLIADLKA
jgi:hypothetical protein